LRIWLGDVSISQAEAHNTGSYGVFPIFVTEVMAEYVKELKFFLNNINQSVANMFKLSSWLLSEIKKIKKV